MYQIINNFEIHLNKKQLLPSTIKVYVKIIRELVKNYGIDPDINKINEYISIKCKNRQPVVKYAIKYYLKFRWRNNLVHKLVKAKVKKAKIIKTFLNKEQAVKIIKTIDNETHRLIAKIQYFTGARASEVISIKNESIKYEPEFNRISIMIVGKNDKTDIIYLNDGLWPEIQKFTTEKKEYIFLKNFETRLSDYVLRTKIESYYRGYYESLREAAKEFNIKIATHDLRRSFAESIRKEADDIIEVQRAMRHENLNTTEMYFKNDPENVSKTMLKHQKKII